MVADGGGGAAAAAVAARARGGSPSAAAASSSSSAAAAASVSAEADPASTLPDLRSVLEECDRKALAKGDTWCEKVSHFRKLRSYVKGE